MQSCTPAELPGFQEQLASITGGASVRKIGEGTFKEAFVVGDGVLSVMPIEGDLEVNGEPQKSASEIIGEVEVHLRLSGLSKLPAPLEGAWAPAAVALQHGCPRPCRLIGD